MSTTMKVKRGDIVLVDLDGAQGHEAATQGKARPCVVVQNDRGNGASPLTIVVSLAKAATFRSIPGQVWIAGSECGQGGRDSVAECGQIRAVDRAVRISRIVGHLDTGVMRRIDDGLRAALGIDAVTTPSTAVRTAAADDAITDAFEATSLDPSTGDDHEVPCWPPRVAAHAYDA